MATTAIVRFRDFEADTIKAHNEVLSGAGAVWWAWWKKESEASMLPELAHIAEACPFGLGLINRETDKRFVGRCTRVEFGVNGESLRSPDPAKTPTYYRNAEFPAWFLLSHITEITAREWHQRFGIIPSGEPTLFISTAGPSQLASVPIDEGVPLIDAEVPSSVILHLSDPHFGSDHGFPLHHRDTPPLQQRLDEEIEQGLEEVNCPRVGLVVMSGDITTKGEMEGFEEAKVFIQRLLKSLRLSKEQIIITPGNHDILLDDTEATRSYSAEQPFRDFLKLACGYDGELNRIHRFSSRDGRDIVILALNSIRPRTRASMEYGYVGRDYYRALVRRIGRMLGEVDSQGNGRPLVIAVLHHHVLPTPLVEEPDPNRPVSLTLDAGELIENLQQVGVDLVLHGHQHIPFVGNTSRACRMPTLDDWSLPSPVHVIGGGSCGVKVGRLWNQMRDNCLGVYVPNAKTLNVKMYRFSPGKSFERFMDFTLPKN